MSSRRVTVRAAAEPRGLRVTVEDRDGERGEGEGAFLPGVSPGSPRELSRSLDGIELALPDGPVLIDALRGAVSSDLPPGARFAIEAALADLWCRRAGVDPVVALGGDPTRPLRLVALLTEIDRAPHQLGPGVTGVKVKVGRPGRAADELDFVRALRRTLPPGASIRIDANRRFDREGAQRWLSAYAELGVELAEEPCPESAALALAGAPLPIALDESLLLDPDRAQLERAIAGGRVAALVLKPSLLGLVGALDWSARGGASIVSHAYEGPVGRRWLLALARCVPPSRFAHGLGPVLGAP